MIPLARKERLLNWLSGMDTGISSKTIAATMEHEPLILQGRSGHPHDPSDLGRCIRLLELFPEYRARLNEMRFVSPVWAQLVDHWDELETLYNAPDERGHVRPCYDRMLELIKAGGGKY